MQERAVQEKKKAAGKENTAASDTATSAEPGAAGTAGASKPDEGSPFACLHATMGWETFHMVHVLLIGLVDMGGKPAERDWELQVPSIIHIPCMRSIMAANLTAYALCTAPSLVEGCYQSIKDMSSAENSTGVLVSGVQ